MATTAEAAAIISRSNDPQGNSIGVAAVASYSFWGGNGAFTAAQQTAAVELMRLWSDVAQISFFVDNEDPEIAYKSFTDPNSEDVGGATGPANAQGYLILNPDTTIQVGFNLANTAGNGLGQGQDDRDTLLHEIGHAIGLEHPDDDEDDLTSAYPEDTQKYSIMSDRNEFRSGADFDGSRSRTPALHDIAAAQRFYGANMATRTGDTTYGFGSNAGPAYFIGSAGEKAVFTIWDAGGIDTLNLSGYAVDQVINLAPGTFSDVGGSAERGLKRNIAMADAVDIGGDNSWEPGFNPGSIANYIENAIGGSGKDTINGSEIANKLEGRGGEDKLYGFGGRDFLYGGALRDTLDGGADVDTLYGEDGNDYLVGGAGVDSLFGGADNDLLDGGSYGVADGVGDRLEGGAGNDEYFVSDSNDLVSETVGGIDTADKVYTTLNSYSLQVSLSLFGEVEILQFVGTGNFVGAGNALANILVGGAGGDTLSGLGGIDYLTGEGGADILNGGTGLDTLVGRAGNDLYELYDVSGNSYDTVVEAASEGVDTVYVRDVSSAARSYTMTANVEDGVIVGAEAEGFTLIGNDKGNRLFDDVGSNTLSGGGGNDKLNGGDGADFLAGGAGDDSYYLADRNGDYDFGAESANGGYDYVYVTPIRDANFLDQYIMFGNVEYGELLGTINFNLFGNAVDNRLFGNSGGNVIFGYSGNDTLSGLAGDDRLNGGDGDDRYFLQDLIFGDGIILTHYDATVESANSGVDSVFVSALDNPDTFSDGYTLEANIENGEIQGLRDFGLDGNELNNVLTGNSGANVLQGLDGDDFLRTGAGADVMDGGDGYDTVVFHQAMVADWQSGVLDADIATDSWAGWEAIQGSSGADRIRTNSWGYAVELRGGGGADVLATGVSGVVSDILKGEAGADTLNGGAGNDTLDGGTEVDTMTGAAGDDHYFVDHAADAITEGAGEGTADRVFAAVSYALGAGDQIERLSTTNNAGTAAINLTGNEFANAIYGNAGANTLNGAGGVDSLSGFGGNDFFFVDNAGDAITETAGQGTGDRVFASVSYVLGAGDQIEIMSTTNNGGTGAINLTGNEFVNTIFGNAGANTLDGRAGADSLIGFGGNDFFFVDNAGDAITEGSGQGTGDRVFAHVSYTLGAGDQVEIMSTTNNAGTGAINLTGNESANTIFGNAGANVLNGKAGNDTLTGFGGSDFFLFDTALNAATNIDRIGDFNVAADTIRLENTVFATLGAPGTLTAAAFRIGAAAADASDRIIYNSATGALIYDANGNAGGGATQFATLAAGLALTNVDFFVV